AATATTAANAPATTGVQPGAADPTATPSPAADPTNTAKQPTAKGEAKPDAVDVTAVKSDAAGNGTPSAAPAPAPAHDQVATTLAAPAATPDGSQQAINATPQLQPPPTTVVPAAQLTATVATHAAVPLSALAVQIAATAQSGKSRFEIRLDPAELGRIDVRMD